MSHETPQEDISDLWAIYQATKAQLEAIQALKSEVAAAYATIAVVAAGSATDDYTSYTRGGLDGNESWTRESLLKRLTELTKTEVELSKLMYEQRMHAIKASPGIVRTRISNQGCGFGRGKW